MESTNLAVQKIRHPIKMRMLQVLRTEWITPYLVSVILTGNELDEFISASFDDHVKLFFPALGQSKPVLPHFNANGSLDKSSMLEVISRDFTPVHYDALKQELEIQFVIHGAGQASTWAAQAKPGDFLGVGGPKGSLLIPMQFDWFLMMGDETAIPAISRRLAELPAEAQVTVMIELEHPESQFNFVSAARVELFWLHQQQTLQQQLATWSLPPGEGFVWAAGESLSMREIYAQLINKYSIDKSRLRISSYWKKGASNVHESYGD